VRPDLPAALAVSARHVAVGVALRIEWTDAQLAAIDEAWRRAGQPASRAASRGSSSAAMRACASQSTTQSSSPTPPRQPSALRAELGGGSLVPALPNVVPHDLEPVQQLGPPLVGL